MPCQYRDEGILLIQEQGFNTGTEIPFLKSSDLRLLALQYNQYSDSIREDRDGLVIR